ncbi:hypothetical protein AFI02nite_25090 [Aliivibrio fischeri]|uniref:Uncharacterized protein n=1 Tax=Aliivibrio fischeri TaxID=668 RepID=A0A510UIL0_ALIFS|nr:hypothetical protein AFI02nite_25090 [Aliivibrio fischeri]GGK50537.1 hypothetical protein GCM10007987_37020 [Aliivibrio fischeri]
MLIVKTVKPVITAPKAKAKAGDTVGNKEIAPAPSAAIAIIAMFELVDFMISKV